MTVRAFLAGFFTPLVARHDLLDRRAREPEATPTNKEKVS